MSRIWQLSPGHVGLEVPDCLDLLYGLVGDLDAELELDALRDFHVVQ